MAEPHGRDTTTPSQTGVFKRLTLWDTVSILVGIVVGTAIFRSSPIVFQNTATAWGALGIWLVGGCLCLCGALCYAELATTYPRNGGDYEYLSRAFGPWVGFLFGWAQLAAILTGSIGAMGYAFADYGSRVWNWPPPVLAWVAAGAITTLTVANMVGLVVGKSLQNLLTVAKILGLGSVILAGLFCDANHSLSTAGVPVQGPGVGLAMVFVLYAFGGWSDAVFVAAEVRDPRRNLPRALLSGILAVTVLYLAVNFVYLRVLGLEAARAATAPAADVMQRALGEWGTRTISILVMISALGAINGMILSGSRIYSTVGEDYALFAWLGKRSQKAGSPIVAMLLQGCVAVLLVFAVGTATGRQAVDVVLTGCGLPALPWDQYFGGFETLVAGTAPVFWLFFLLTGVSLFVLRRRHPERQRPFSVPWFPLPPVVFCLTCAYMLYSSLDYARLLSLIGIVPFFVGIPLYLCGRRTARPNER